MQGSMKHFGDSLVSGDTLQAQKSNAVDSQLQTSKSKYLTGHNSIWGYIAVLEARINDQNSWFLNNPDVDGYLFH